MSNAASITGKIQTLADSREAAEKEPEQPSLIDWKSIWKPLSIIIGVFLVIFWLPLESSRFTGAVIESLALTKWYADVEKVTEVMKIAGYGVFGTPAVVVDGEVKSVGKIPSKEDVKSWLGK